MRTQALHPQGGLCHPPSPASSPPGCRTSATTGARNQIPLSGTDEQIRRLVFRIVTDSRSPAEPKNPDTILALYGLLADPADADELARRYRERGVGYAEAKALLTEAIQRLIAAARSRHADLMADPADLQATLASGAARAPEVRRGNAGCRSGGRRAGLGLTTSPDTAMAAERDHAARTRSPAGQPARLRDTGSSTA